jgi:hypothetical protein
MDHQQKPTDMSTFGTCRQCQGGCRKHSRDSNSSENRVIPWPQSRPSEVVSSTISNVQIALQDQTYAEQLRSLLEEDGKHRVHVLDRPIRTLAGIVVLDEATLRFVGVLEETDALRYVVLRKDFCDPDELWERGVRYLVPLAYSLNLVRTLILGMELHLHIEQGPEPPI